jgi:hypothetical protein
MYFMLAIVWLVAGVALIIYDNYTGNSAWVVRGLGWSPGWLMLLMSAYNFVRWWSRRQNRASHDAEYRASLERRRYRGDVPPVRREAPDPNFNFSDTPNPEAPAETAPKTQPPASS